MKINHRKNTSITRKRALLIAACLILLLAAGATYALIKQTPSPVADPNTTSSDFNKVDLTPPTDQDKAYNDAIKENLGNDRVDTPSESGKKSVSVTIVDAKQYNDTIEVRAYVNSVVESGGTCKLVFTLGNEIVTKSVPARADAQNSTCNNVIIPITEFKTKGTWKLVITYSSEASEGKSDNKDVVIR